MRRAVDWIFGIVSLLIGVSIGAWIAYNDLIEMQPEAKGLSPLPALGMTLICIYVGVTRIRKGMRKSDPQGSA